MTKKYFWRQKFSCCYDRVFCWGYGKDTNNLHVIFVTSRPYIFHFFVFVLENPSLTEKKGVRVFFPAGFSTGRDKIGELWKRRWADETFYGCPSQYLGRLSTLSPSQPGCHLPPAPRSCEGLAGRQEGARQRRRKRKQRTEGKEKKRLEKNETKQGKMRKRKITGKVKKKTKQLKKGE